MVLWEMALGTAYFMGLPRTYRLAMKIQKKLISSKHPRIRRFVHRSPFPLSFVVLSSFRRTRNVFNVALKVQRNVREREIEVRRKMGNLSSRVMWWSRPLPTVAAMMRPGNPMGGHTQDRHFSTRQRFGRGNWDGVIRKDIAQWMRRK